MKITVEIEPVLCEGRLSDKQYYGFKIVGGPAGILGAPTPIYTCANAVYPGNEALREFFNQKSAEELK